jgi:hypothetical protein
LTHRRSMTGPWSMVDITVKLVQFVRRKNELESWSCQTPWSRHKYHHS